jgi:hypothetical protein
MKKEDKELPPFFNTWNQVYIAVLLNLVAVIIFLSWFSKLFQ